MAGGSTCLPVRLVLKAHGVTSGFNGRYADYSLGVLWRNAVWHGLGYYWRCFDNATI